MLDHHRGLGIETFFVVDNGSTDGSVEFLLAQPDVHLWTTEDSFGAAHCGTDWVLALIDEYGSGRLAEMHAAGRPKQAVPPR